MRAKPEPLGPPPGLGSDRWGPWLWDREGWEEAARSSDALWGWKTLLFQGERLGPTKAAATYGDGGPRCSLYRGGGWRVPFSPEGREEGPARGPPALRRILLSYP